MIIIEKASVFVPNNKNYKSEKGPSPADIPGKFRSEKEFTERMLSAGFIYESDIDCFTRECAGYHHAINMDIGCSDLVDGKFVERAWIKK